MQKPPEQTTGWRSLWNKLWRDKPALDAPEERSAEMTSHLDNPIHDEDAATVTRLHGKAHRPGKLT